MEGPGISKAAEAELDRLISKAIDGDETASDELQQHEWLWDTVGRITRHAARRFEVDADDLLSHVLAQVRCKITTVRKEGKRKPHVRLAGWCRSAARNRCLNLIRPRSKEVRLDDEQEAVELRSACMSPEEELERKEWDAIRERGEPKAFQAVRRVFETLTPEDAEVILKWAEGETLKEMAGELGVACTGSMNHKLTRVQKIFFRELMKVGVGEIGESWAEDSGVTRLAEHSTRDDRAGLRELIAHCLQDILARGPEPPPAAFA
jgi:DNA-directed RNA polymerase specialized sigma24 family protein